MSNTLPLPQPSLPTCHFPTITLPVLAIDINTFLNILKNLGITLPTLPTIPLPGIPCPF